MRMIVFPQKIIRKHFDLLFSTKKKNNKELNVSSHSLSHQSHPITPINTEQRKFKMSFVFLLYAIIVFNS